jgi:hypothetical protein
MNILRLFHTRGPILKVFGIIQVVLIVVHGDIPKLMALMLWANRLLAMAKNIGGLCPIIISEVFFDLLVIPLSFNFKGHFKSTYPPISLEYWPLEVVRPSLVAFEPSSTYTLIRL